MVAQSLLDSVFALPTDERIDLLHRLQDNLLADPAYSSLSDEHRAILEERLADMEANPDAGEPWDVVYERLKSRFTKP